MAYHKEAVMRVCSLSAPIAPHIYTVAHTRKIKISNIIIIIINLFNYELLNGIVGNEEDRKRGEKKKQERK